MKNIFNCCVCLTLFVVLLATGGVADAKDKNYATEDEALKEAFPDSAFKKQTIELTSYLKERITENLGKNVYEASIDVFEATLGGAIQGYGFVMNQVGKTKNITFMVSIDTEGTVVAVKILTFRESQGFEVKNKRWLAQFKGKDLLSRLRVKKDIDNISGATMSSRAVTKGVARAISMFHALKDDLSLVYFK